MLRLFAEASQSLCRVNIWCYSVALGGLETADRKIWSHISGQLDKEDSLRELAQKLSLGQ
jgi:hypothetical protein